REPAALRRQGTGRAQLVLGTDAMKPYRRVSGANLAMYRAAVGSGDDTTGLEAESVDQEVVCCLDVVVNEDWSDELRLGHGRHVTRGPVARLGRGCRVYGGSSERFKTIPGWVRTSLRVTAARRCCCRRR